MVPNVDDDDVGTTAVTSSPSREDREGDPSAWKASAGAAVGMVAEVAASIRAISTSVSADRCQCAVVAGGGSVRRIAVPPALMQSQIQIVPERENSRASVSVREEAQRVRPTGYGYLTHGGVCGGECGVEATRRRGHGLGGLATVWVVERRAPRRDCAARVLEEDHAGQRPRARARSQHDEQASTPERIAAGRLFTMRSHVAYRVFFCHPRPFFFILRVAHSASRSGAKSTPRLQCSQLASDTPQQP